MKGHPITKKTTQPADFRLLAVIVLSVLAFAAAVTGHFLHNSCQPCELAKAVGPVPKLALVGALYYASLAVALWRFKFNRYTTAAVYFAAGCHIELLLTLYRHGLSCLPCIAAAACVLTAAAVTMSAASVRLAHSAWRAAQPALCAALFGFVLMLGTSVLRIKYNEYRLVERAKGSIRYDLISSKLTEGKALPVYVYRFTKCGRCRRFIDLTVPKLSASYSDRIALHVTNAPEECPTSLIIVGGTKPAFIAGISDWKKISSTVDSALKKWRPGQLEKSKSGNDLAGVQGDSIQ